MKFADEKKKWDLVPALSCSLWFIIFTANPGAAVQLVHRVPGAAVQLIHRVPHRVGSGEDGQMDRIIRMEIKI